MDDEDNFSTCFWNSAVCVIDIGSPNHQITNITVTLRYTSAFKKNNLLESSKTNANLKIVKIYNLLFFNFLIAAVCTLDRLVLGIFSPACHSP
jgi:hypothetical protein